MTATAERPLAGVRVVVTRAGPDGEPLSRMLGEFGAEVVRLTTIEIRDPEDWQPVDEAIDRLAVYALAIFTSANGVTRFFGRLERHGLGAVALGHLPVVAIGPATAAALRQRGVDVAAIPDEYRAEGVLQEARRLLEARGAPERARVLLPRAAEARAALPDGLRSLGIEVDVVAVYRTVRPAGGGPAADEALARGVDVITFTSSSTVRNFLALVGTERAMALLEGVVVGCIGPITAEAARRAGLTVAIQPREYTLEAFVGAIADHFRRTAAAR